MFSQKCDIKSLTSHSLYGKRVFSDAEPAEKLATISFEAKLMLISVTFSKRCKISADWLKTGIRLCFRWANKNI